MQENSESKARKSIVLACKKMIKLGLTQGTSGNISIRYNNYILISPSGIHYDDMTTNHIVSMDMEGKWTCKLDGIEPSTEWRFHLDIMKYKKSVNAVVHAHPIFSTVLSIMKKQIPPLHYMIVAGGGNNIPCIPYATYGTIELSNFILHGLKDRHACLLANHGIVVTGSNLKKTMWLAIEVESLARQYYYCLQIGQPSLLTEEELKCVFDKWHKYGLR